MSQISEQIEKAGVLVEALPYIKRFAGQTIVVKFGGSIANDVKARASFAADMVLLKYVGINPVIIHGGGPEITQWMEKLGKPPVFVQGQRITDRDTMEIVEMVLTGKINSGLVSLINQAGGKAVGLSGKDAHLIDARRMKPKGGTDLGYVGEIESADGALIRNLSDGGYIPVISSVSEDTNGETLNVNADSAASAIAIALKAEKLIFLTDVAGLQLGGKLVDYLDLEGAERALSGSDISGGMIPKMQDAVRAIKRGVSTVHIINGTNQHAVLLEMFTNHGVGTMISHQKRKGGAA